MNQLPSLTHTYPSHPPHRRRALTRRSWSQSSMVGRILPASSAYFRTMTMMGAVELENPSLLLECSVYPSKARENRPHRPSETAWRPTRHTLTNSNEHHSAAQPQLSPSPNTRTHRHPHPPVPKGKVAPNSTGRVGKARGSGE